MTGKHSRESKSLSLTSVILISLYFIGVVAICNHYFSETVIAKSTLAIREEEVRQLVSTVYDLRMENEKLSQSQKELLQKNAVLKRFMDTTVHNGPTEAVADKMVVISFDDLSTDRLRDIIEIAKDKGVPLSLFPTGDSLRRQPEMFRFALASGHTIGNHTDHHDWLGQLSESQVKKTINAWNATAEELLGGYETIFFRPPGMSGWINRTRQTQLERWVNDTGAIPILWSLETYYDLYASNGPHRRGPQPTIADEIDYIVKSAKPGDIILLHDTAADVKALSGIIDGLRAKSLSIVSIGKMLGLEKVCSP